MFSIVSKSDLSIKPYILGKFLQGIFAGIYTYIALHYIPFLNLDLIPVFSGENITVNLSTPKLSPVFYIVLLFFVSTFIFLLSYKKNKRTYFRF